MTKKKIIIISIISVFLIALIVGIVLLVHHLNTNNGKLIGAGVVRKAPKNKNGLYDVYVYKWDGSHNTDNVCEIEHSSITVRQDDMETLFYSKFTLDELAKQNEHFISKFTYYDSGIFEYDANLYFIDNNYYIIYHNPEYDNDKYSYTAINAVTELSYEEIDHPRAVVPFPMDILICKRFLEEHPEQMNFFFDKFTFESACEFYERFTDDTVEIDYDNRLIYVDARELNSEDTHYDKHLCIDFNNRYFIREKGNKNELVYD